MKWFWGVSLVSGSCVVFKVFNFRSKQNSIHLLMWCHLLTQQVGPDGEVKTVLSFHSQFTLLPFSLPHSSSATSYHAPFQWRVPFCFSSSHSSPSPNNFTSHFYITTNTPFSYFLFYQQLLQYPLSTKTYQLIMHNLVFSHTPTTLTAVFTIIHRS